ncbi:MAG: nucleotidyltransferase family protein [Caldilineaceae bacterium]
MHLFTQPTLTLLLRCCRQPFGPAEVAAIHQWLATNAQGPPVEWDLFYQLAFNHGVAPLVFNNLQRVGLAQLALPPAIIAAFQQITYQTIAVKSGIRTKLVEMLAFCAERNIRVMIIKGAALDLAIYQEPWYVIHDVDLIFDQDQAALAPTIFAELDRYFWDLPGFEYDFYGHHDVTMNGLLAIDFAAIWAVATPIDLDGQVAWLMCPTDMLLAACINSCRKRFFRLKSLLAIATLVAHQPAPEWSLLFAAAHRYGCGAIVYTALLATEQTLGCALPAALAHSLGLSTVRAQLLQGLIEHTAQATLLQGTATFSPTQRRVDQSLLLPMRLIRRPNSGAEPLAGEKCDNRKTNVKLLT